MAFMTIFTAWRKGWIMVGKIHFRDIAKPDNALFYKLWFSWRLPAFWGTAMLFCLPLSLIAKAFADANHTAAALVVFVANISVVFPLGAYFASKWWIESK